MKARRTKRVSAKSIREKNVASFAQNAAKYAVNRAAQKNVSVTVASRGKIYRIHPEGSMELVNTLPEKVKVKNHIIKIAD